MSADLKQRLAGMVRRAIGGTFDAVEFDEIGALLQASPDPEALETVRSLEATIGKHVRQLEALRSDAVAAVKEAEEAGAKADAARLAARRVLDAHQPQGFTRRTCETHYDCDRIDAARTKAGLPLPKHPNQEQR